MAVSFFGLKSDLASKFVMALLYMVFCNTWTWYKGTKLCQEMIKTDFVSICDD